MSEDGWRTSIRWVMAHPTEPRVLLARRDGALRLPGSELPGQVWTAEPGPVLPRLRDLLGADALLLRSLDEHEDPSARVKLATLLVVPRALPALPDGLAWAGRGELAGAAGDAGDVWFKATAASPLFVDEGPVMGALAGLFPDQVPAPLAVDPGRGWMVLDDRGEEVGWEAPLEVAEEVVRAFVRLQVEAAGPGAPAVGPARGPAPRGQLPVAGGRDDAAGRVPHGRVDRLVAAPDAGRPWRPKLGSPWP